MFIEVFQIMLQEGDLPDAVVHLADADELAGEHDAEVDLATAQADESRGWCGRGRDTTAFPAADIPALKACTHLTDLTRMF